MPTSELFIASIQTPIGLMVLKATATTIVAVEFREESPQEPSCDILEGAQKQIEEYFSGTRTSFELSLAPDGTEFEQGVWNELQSVKFGATASYLDIAKKLNNTGAIRAVGRANGANPIAIIIPCHRIVGSDGSLTGYAGGLWRKRWLLDHEAKIAGTALF